MSTRRVHRIASLADSFFKWSCLAFVATIVIFSLCGCSQEDVRKAQEVEDRVAQALKVAIDNREQTAATLKQMVALYEKVATSDPTKATEVKAQADAMREKIAQADNAIKVIADNYQTAKTVTDASIKSAAAGGGLMDILLAGLSVLAPTAAGWIVTYRNLTKARTAVKLTAAYGDSLEKLLPEGSDPTPQKENAQQSQVAAGVHDLIQTLRNKS